MGKPKPRKVFTPGTQPDQPRKAGRPSKRKDKLGTSRKDNYKTKYSDGDLEMACADVKSKKLSIRAASIKYKVPRTTIGDHIMERVGAKLGRPTELTEEEEATIADRLVLMATWGFPMDSKDTRYLIKVYLDTEDRHTRFEDNMPGPDWLEGFMSRHPHLTMRRANLIKRSRGAVSREIVLNFFQHYSKVVEDIPPENIWNYDETNLRNNPGNTFFQKLKTP